MPTTTQLALRSHKNERNCVHIESGIYHMELSKPDSIIVHIKIKQEKTA